MTDNLGFFFGPGRPFSLIGPLGSIEGGARLRPDVPGAALFLLSPALVGADESLPSVPSTGAALGVAFDSDDLSVGSGGATEGDGSALVGVADDLDDGGATSEGKQARRLAERLRVTILLFLLPALDAMLRR